MPGPLWNPRVWHWPGVYQKDAQARAYHGTPGGFEVLEHDRSGLGTHFGTKDSASAGGRGLGMTGPDQTFQNPTGQWEVRGYDLDVRNPLRLDDINSWNRIENVVSELYDWTRPRILQPQERNEALRLAKADPKAAWGLLRGAIERAGYDSVVYTNKHEDVGNDSYIVWDNAKIKRVGYGAGGLALDLGDDAPEPSPGTNLPLEVRGPLSGGDWDGQPSHLTLDHNLDMPYHEGSAGELPESKRGSMEPRYTFDELEAFYSLSLQDQVLFLIKETGHCSVGYNSHRGIVVKVSYLTLKHMAGNGLVTLTRSQTDGSVLAIAPENRQASLHTASRSIVVTIPKNRVREVEAEEAGNTAGLGYYWQMGRLPKETPSRIYFAWDGAVRAYHEVTGMDRDAGQILMDPTIHDIDPVPMGGFRGFRYYAERGVDLQMLDQGVPSGPLTDSDEWAEGSDVNQFDDGGGTQLHLGQAQPQARQPWLACDLDGTILEHEPGMAARGEFGEVKPGAAEALGELEGLGWRITIFTARLADLDETAAGTAARQIASYLAQKNVPFTDVWVGRKPRADYFVDDKAIHFGGDWQEVLLQLVQEQPSDVNLDSNGLPPGTTDELGAVAGNGLIDTQDGPNDFADSSIAPRRDRSFSHDPELEEVIY